MASKQWSSLPQRKKNSAKKKVFNELKDIFGSEYEDKVIITIAENCNYDLEKTTNSLLKISETKHQDVNDTSTSAYDPWRDEKLPWEKEMVPEVQNINCKEYKDITGATSQQTINNSKVFRDEKSLCGLKIQYHSKNSQHKSISIDDDADVVIENESQSSSSSSRSISPEQAKSTSTLSSMPTHAQLKQMPDMSDSFHKRIMEPINNGYKILILMRGVPGCGKSYLARRIINHVPGATYNNYVFSADDYFMRSGVYKFDANYLTNAHSYCQNMAFQAMKEGKSPIIIDNTNTQFWEMHMYVTTAVNFGYIIETLEPETKWAWKAHELEKRNCHGIPKTKIELMIKRYESNLSGKDLLKGTMSKYHKDCTPPQMRNLPPLPNKSSTVHSVPIQQQVTKSVLATVNMLDVQKPSLPSLINQHMGMPKMSTLETKEPVKIIPSVPSVELPNMPESLLNKQTPQMPISKENILNLSTVNHLSSTIQTDFENQNSTFKEVDPFTNNNMTETKVNSTSYEKSSINDTFKENYLLEETKKLCTSNFDQEENSNRVELEHIYSLFTKSDDSSFKTINEMSPAIRLKPIITKMSELQAEDVKTNVDAEYNETEFITESLKITPTINTSKKISNIEEAKEPLSLLEKKQNDDVIEMQIDKSSDCKDFSIFINGMTVHSRYPNNFEINENLNSSEVIIVNDPVSNNTTKSTKVDQDKISTSNKDDELNRNVSEILDNNKRLLYSEEKDEKIYIQEHKKFCTNVKEPGIVPDYMDENIESPIQSDNSSNKDSSFEFVGDNTPSFIIYDGDDIFVKEPTDELNVDDSSTLDQQLYKPDTTFESNCTPISESLSHHTYKSNKTAESDTVYKEEYKGLDAFDFESNANTKTEGFDSSRVLMDARSEASFFPPMFSGTKTYENAPKIKGNISASIEDGDVASTSLRLEENVKNSYISTTVDCSTSTDPYDFNLAYFEVGLDGYKIVKAVNRNINDLPMPMKDQENHVPLENKLGKKTTCLDQENNILLKVTSDKETNSSNLSVIKTANINNTMDEIGTEDRSIEILNQFPDWSSDIILNIYKNGFKGNYEDTVKYLNSIQNVESENLSDTENIDLVKGIHYSLSSSSRSSSSSPDEKEIKIKKKKNKKTRKRVVTDEKVALATEMMNKFKLSDKSYPSYTLNIKRLRNQQFEEPANFLSRNLETLGISEDPMTTDSAVPEHVNTEPVKNQELQSNDEEIVNLNVGFEFLKNIEILCGGGELNHDGIHPVIQMPKSMAQELYALWIKSINEQYTHAHEQLDLMIAKDEEYAQSLMYKHEETNEKPEVCNLKEIMDMELALATYKNNKHGGKLPREIKQKVTRATLQEIFPNFDPTVVQELYEANDQDFEKTYEVLKENNDHTPTLTLAQILKKRKHLIDELHKEKYKTLSSNLLVNKDKASGGCSYEIVDDEEFMTFEEAFEYANNSRLEARRQSALLNKNYNKAQMEYKKKNHQVAAYYSDVAKLHKKNMERANEEAATAYLAAQLYLHNSDNQIDLHNLHVTEALLALSLFIDSQLNNMERDICKEIFIITGKGTHSIHGQSRIKPAVALFLNQKNINFVEVSYNAGMLKAILKKR